ncbi:MAG: MATE family efflux transporter [Treponema sp.]|nr:MATE family efflux transporter [Treponema sp.]
MQSKNQIDMLSGSLLDKICLFALPLAASSILQQLFNSADVAVVGRFASSQALAAVGSTSSTINLLINLFVGLSVGANVVIAQFIGQNKPRRIHEAVHTVISIALVSGFFLVVVGQFAARPILTLMNTPDDVIEMSVLYLRLYFLGMPFIMLYNFGSAILRSKGDSKRPLYCLTLAGVINLLLNLLLVIVFKLGVAGVAIATVVSNVVSSGLIVSFLLHEDAPFKLNLRELSLKKEYIIRVVRIGAPAGLQGMVFSFSNVCIQSAINSFGSDCVAGSAAANNFEAFAFFTVSAFTQACVTFTSQNYGAHKFDRCRRVFRISLICGIVSNMTMVGLFLLFRVPLLSLYSTNAQVIQFGLIRMLHALPFDFIMCGYEVSAGALRGMGHSMLPAVITIFGTCVFRLLWVFTIFTQWRSFEMLISVYPASWTLTAVFMLTVYFFVRRREFASAQSKNL